MGNQDDEHRYMRLHRCPDSSPEEVKELRLRSRKTDRDMCHRLRLCQSMVIERVRESNTWASAYQKSFDREIYLGQGADPVPRDLITYARCYMEKLPIGLTQSGDTPIPSHSTVYEFLKSKLDMVLRSSQLDKECTAHAKTVSGFAGRAARNLFRAEDPPVEPAYVFTHLQCLQEYQVRQLVEQALFQGPDCNASGITSPDSKASNVRSNQVYWRPEGGTDHTMERFTEWIEGIEDVKTLQDAVNEKRPWFRADPQKMDLDSSWAKRVEKVHTGGTGEMVDKVGRFQMMLTPALEMVQAMEFCTTPCQKVRLWAEAILEAISLINMQIGEEGQIGGPDVPSIVLFLTCITESHNLVTQAKLARLFCLDNYDQKEFRLPDGGLYQDMAEQYAFAAEERAIDHSHYLLWAEDTLRIIAEESTPAQPQPPANATVNTGADGAEAAPPPEAAADQACAENELSEMLGSI